MHAPHPQPGIALDSVYCLGGDGINDDRKSEDESTSEFTSEIFRDNEWVNVRRITTFTSRVMTRRYDKDDVNVIDLWVNWSRNEDLRIRISYTLTPKERDYIRPHNLVQFRIQRDEQKQKWIVTDLVRIESPNEKRLKMVKLEMERQNQERLERERLRTVQEQQQKVRMEREARKWKKMVDDMMQREIIRKTQANAKSSGIVAQWKFRGNDGDYHLYEPDISDELECLEVGDVTVVMEEYAISKLTIDSAIQMKMSTGTERQVKRYDICGRDL